MPLETLTENISFRCTKKEKRTLKKEAKAKNMRPSEYIRYLILQADVKKVVAVSD